MASIDVIASSRELFGADRCCIRLCQVLVSLGHEPTLILPADRPERGLAELAKCSRIPTADADVSLATSHGVHLRPGLFKRVRGRRPDFTFLNSASILGSSRPAGARVVMLREWLDPRSCSHRVLCAWHRMQAHSVVAVSSGVLRQWQKCVPGPSRKHVVWDWLDASYLDDRPDTGPKHRSGIVFLGRFNQWKGQELLADAYEDAFARSAPRPTLTFIGDQPGTEFAEYGQRIRARATAIGGAVYPFASDPRRHLENAALLVLPSLHPEPFGMVVVEALAAGCKVIATDGGGPSDLAPLFPGAIRLVSRDRTCIAESLRQWWGAGGLPQDEALSAQTIGTLRGRLSPSAATSLWRSILAP